MCTAALTENLPDFLSGGASGTKDGPGPIRNATDVPLGDSADEKERSILQRRERIKQAQEHPGSHIPTGVRTRKDLMDELT